MIRGFATISKIDARHPQDRQLDGIQVVMLQFLKRQIMVLPGPHVMRSTAKMAHGILRTSGFVRFRVTGTECGAGFTGMEACTAFEIGGRLFEM